MKLLIAEDDKDLRYGLQVFFQKNNFTVDAVDNGADALAYLQLGNYDAAVLDVMMPKMDGVTVVRMVRAEKNATPILLLTAKSEIEDRIAGLDAGANDYLPKPFDIRELLARVRVLTRPQGQQSARMQIGNICLDTTCFMLIGPNGEQPLTNKEYQTFLLLMQAPATPVSVERIMYKVWEPDRAGQENALWTIVYNLRKKLSAIGADVTIQNKRNLGYVLEARQ
ncbi:MAG: response regulator transcription factor [Oscillospiraceae bacterium]|nr:response regulator transcription factor [Oscillospiraceae bacterium]